MCRLCGAKCERELRSVYGDRWLLIYCVVVPCACVFVYVSFLVNISMLQRYCFYCVHVCQSVLTYWTFRCTEIDYRVGVTTLSGGGRGRGETRKHESVQDFLRKSGEKLWGNVPEENFSSKNFVVNFISCYTRCLERKKCRLFNLLNLKEPKPVVIIIDTWYPDNTSF